MAIAAGIGVGLLVVLLYMIFADERKLMPRWVGYITHHAMWGVMLIIASYFVYEVSDIGAYFLWGMGLSLTFDDFLNHARDFMEKRRAEGKIHE